MRKPSLLRKLRYGAEVLLALPFYAAFRLLPLSVASAVGGRLALWFGPCFKAHRTALANVRMVFPDINGEECRKIVQSMWENIGRVAGEFPHVAHLSKEGFFRICEVEGAEHIRVTKERGGIFIAGHLANWEIAPKTAAVYERPLALVYRKANNPVVDALINHNRKAYQSVGLPKGARGARGLLSVLKEKGLVGMLVDQKMNDGIPVPFFGRKAMTAPAVAALALKTGVPIIPARVIRLKGARFKVIVYPPLEIAATGNQEQDIYAVMCSINTLLEGWIREHPEQWLWAHKRWPKESR